MLPVTLWMHDICCDCAFSPDLHCRFDSRATNTWNDRGEPEQQRRLFDSGISADRTTLVLGRSASWKVAAGRAAGEGESVYLQTAGSDGYNVSCVPQHKAD
jgi:hypothetical protein